MDPRLEYLAYFLAAYLSNSVMVFLGSSLRVLGLTQDRDKNYPPRAITLFANIL